MIDEWSPDGLGFARFSADRRMRYRLARFFTEAAATRWRDTRVVLTRSPSDYDGLKMTTFVMVNPSTANAFKPDPTVSRCIEFARRWGCNAIEVVNLFALVSPYPEDLYRAATTCEPTGADFENDVQIVDGCQHSQFVIAAWGNHGRLNNRANAVIELLGRNGVELKALRVLPSGIPSHPLARGKNFISYDTKPVRFDP